MIPATSLAARIIIDEAKRRKSFGSILESMRRDSSSAAIISGVSFPKSLRSARVEKNVHLTACGAIVAFGPVNLTFAHFIPAILFIPPASRSFQTVHIAA